MSKEKDNFLTVKVITRSSCNEIIGWQNDFLKVKLAVTPIKGQANTKLLDLLADFLSIPTSELKIVRGFTTNKKRICLPVDAVEKLKKTIF